jgi:DNA invertase Pin-like site-specific DNA recombinase
MTREQAEQIRALRMQGKGYKAVASAVGLSRDIVRNYCRANRMEGYGEAVKLNLQREMAEKSAAMPGA